ncbi:MAG: ATP-binding protein [Actinophytocola sp.]|uniref:ATP-binding protein n=1 Tax=Actinophytocola sp. TaxID=1872138 RepID=UPI003C750801
MAKEDVPVAAQGDRHRHTLELTGSDAHALTRVRRWIREMLVGVGHAHVLDVIQVADELASNAYEHAGGPRAVHVCHRSAPRQTTVEVDDTSPLGRLTLGTSRFGKAACRGHGLQIVDQLTSAWGVRCTVEGRGGKTVWAEIPFPGRQ